MDGVRLRQVSGDRLSAGPPVVRLRQRGIGRSEPFEKTLDSRKNPVPFGPDIYAQFGDEFALPVVGNFDPPATGSSVVDPIPVDEQLNGIKGLQAGPARDAGG